LVWIDICNRIFIRRRTQAAKRPHEAICRAAERKEKRREERKRKKAGKEGDALHFTDPQAQGKRASKPAAGFCRIETAAYGDAKAMRRIRRVAVVTA
jgi:hypothetical protein